MLSDVSGCGAVESCCRDNGLLSGPQTAKTHRPPMEEVDEGQRPRPLQRMHHLPPHVVPDVLLRTRALQEEDGGWQGTRVVVGEEGRGEGGGGEWEEQCSADDVISGTTAGPAVWRCAPLPQPWSVGGKWLVSSIAIKRRALSFGS